MLRRMVIKNFKCFKNETIFDFRRTNYKVLEKNTCGKIVKGALFVGDNASGKTTAIQPIRLLLELLFKDKDIMLALYTCLFSKEEVTTLRYEFEIGGHEIIYAFSFRGNFFVEEKLSMDEKIVIERLGENAKLYLKDEAVFHEIDKSILFLKRVYFNTKFAGNEILVKWFDFLKKSVYIDAYRREMHIYNGENLGIKKYMEEYGVDSLNEFLSKNNFRYSIQYASTIEGKETRYEMDEDEGKGIFFDYHDMEEPIPLHWESLGNKTLLNILPAIISAVKNGGMLIMDEFSSGLHNKLEELLVKYIMREGERTQLFFVSHSTNLLTNSILRPDQIYAVEMAGNEGSFLSRFSDEQPRVAQNLEKMYLSGVFGGIPEYGTFKE